MTPEEIKERAAHLTIEKRAYINGEFADAADGQIIEKVSPVDGRDLSGLSACGDGDIHRAALAARQSFDAGIWRDADPQEKKQTLLKLADLMEEQTETLALLDTLETGRSFKNYMYDSIPKAIEAIRYFAEGVDKYYDFAVPPRKNSFATITREPIGVVGLITPWNDPMVVASWKFAPALLMGNSVVVKPAEQSSFSLLKVAELSRAAGLPDGVFNVVTGYGEIAGKALALHMDVDGVFFTGSSEVGKLILQYSGQSNMKKVGLECGGKSPFIITPQYGNLESAAKTLAKNIFYNQGQICSAPSRVMVHADQRQELIALLKKECGTYMPGDPFDIASEVGCVVSLEQKKKIDGYIAAGIQSGATMYCPSVGESSLPGACAVLPTIFYNIDNASPLAREEIFGPVLVVLDYKTIDEALTMANDTHYGLAASVWTQDLDEAHRISRALRAGIVHINSYGADDNTVPFGGFKESGIGKDKSMFAFDEYSHLKTTWVQFS